MKRLFISITILFLLGSINAQTTVSLFKTCGKYGIINADKKIIIPANFDEIKIDEVIFCKNNTGKSIVYDDKLKILYQFNNGENKIKMISPIYAAADYYSENLIPVVLNDSDNKPGKSYYFWIKLSISLKWIKIFHQKVSVSVTAF